MFEGQLVAVSHGPVSAQATGHCQNDPVQVHVTVAPHQSVYAQLVPAELQNAPGNTDEMPHAAPESPRVRPVGRGQPAANSAVTISADRKTVLPTQHRVLGISNTPMCPSFPRQAPSAKWIAAIADAFAQIEDVSRARDR